jgi:hypothetical protein
MADRFLREIRDMHQLRKDATIESDRADPDRIGSTQTPRENQISTISRVSGRSVVLRVRPEVAYRAIDIHACWHPKADWQSKLRCLLDSVVVLELTAACQECASRH